MCITVMDERVNPETEAAEHWGRVRSILDYALDLPVPERQPYIARACQGNPALHAEVAALLEGMDQSVWFEQPPTLPDRSTSTFEMPAAQTPLAPGQTFGPYHVVEQIGQGGMGAIYKAVDRRLGRTVALKVISKFRGSGVEKRRFLQEAKAASALNHPNIVVVYEYDSDHDMDYIAMEYIEGVSLDRILAEGSRPLVTLLRYAADVAGALAKSHQAGIVHRDLKPKNIMVSSAEEVKVLDFGLAKSYFAEAGHDDSQTLTGTGIAIGTPQYMSPEQATGAEADQASDIFSLGIILYEMCCGERPFDCPFPHETLAAIVQKEPQRVDRMKPSLPEKLADLIECCLRKHKIDRPRSMDIVRAELLQVIENFEPTGVTNRHPSSRWLVLFVLMALLAAGATWYGTRSAERSLTWSLVVEKPGSAPALDSVNSVFHSGDRFHLLLESPQPGYFYLVNEGPGAEGQDRFWVLFPEAASTPPIPPGRQTRTPWLTFDDKPGTERLWLVWAGQQVPALERALNVGTGGEVKSPELTAQVHDFVTKSESGSRLTQTKLVNGVRFSASGGLLTSLVKLRHE